MLRLRWSSRQCRGQRQWVAIGRTAAVVVVGAARQNDEWGACGVHDAGEGVGHRRRDSPSLPTPLLVVLHARGGPLQLTSLAHVMQRRTAAHTPQRLASVPPHSSDVSRGPPPAVVFRAELESWSLVQAESLVTAPTPLPPRLLLIGRRTRCLPARAPVSIGQKVWRNTSAKVSLSRSCRGRAQHCRLGWAESPCGVPGQHWR